MSQLDQETATGRSVLWIGPAEGREFGSCYERLAEGCEVTVAKNAAAALDHLHLGQKGFDLAVLACPRPLVTTDPAEAIREAHAPKPLVQLLGTWCEGEGRTGKPIEGVERLFWHAWPAWLSQWQDSHQMQELEQRLSGVVEVRSHDAEFAKSLVKALGASQPAVWSPNRVHALSPPPAAILWDGSQLDGREADDLFTTCQRASTTKTPVIALLDFPRPETVAAARAIGAAAVVGKPFSIERLQDTLRASIPTASHTEDRIIEGAEVEAQEIDPEPTSLREQLRAEREQLATEAA